MEIPQVTDNILFGIIGACVLYLISMYILQKVRAAAQVVINKKARNQYEEAKKVHEEEKRKLINSISMIYGLEQANYVSMGRLWVGMPMNLLMVARGKANNIRQTVGMDTITQTWTYNETDPQTGNSREKLEVVLVNNKVNNWKENS